MVQAETAAMIARNRFVTAQALFEGRADLSGYPHQHLAVVSQRGVGVESLGLALAAADLLSAYGWELVNVSEFTNSNFACAVMRRRPPQPTPR